MSARGAHTIGSAEQLWALVGEPTEKVIAKELAELDARAAAFIARSPFLVMSTTGADGSADASPKGGPPGFVRVLDAGRLLIPEFPGNRRFDGVQNLVEVPAIGLLFIVPGIAETLRVNGVATLTRDPVLLEACAVDGKQPWFAADVDVRQAFSHCAKAFLRSELWKPESWPDADAIASPSGIIGELAAQAQKRDSEVRREVEAEYRPNLY